MAFLKMIVAATATTLALLAPVVRAEQQDVLRTGAAEALEQEVAVPDWVSEPQLNATYSNYIKISYEWVMMVSSYYSKDKRTSQSYFVCATDKSDLMMTVKFSANPVGEDVLIQVDSVDGNSWAAKNTKGWYLSVLDEVLADETYPDYIKYPGYFRLSIQPDKSKATKWYFSKPTWDDESARFMKIRDAPGLPLVKDWGMVVASFAVRDSTSKYVLVYKTDFPSRVQLK